MSQVHSMVEYREIPEYVGYRFGSDGSIWSRWVPGHRILGEVWRTRRPFKGKHGYLQTYFFSSIENDHLMKRVHIMILVAFFGPCPDGMECRHLNGDKTDNRIDNLKWGTKIENAADRGEHGTQIQGSKHKLAKLTEEKVIEIRRRYKVQTPPCTMDEIAKDYGVSLPSIHRIIHRKSWVHV